MKSQKHTNLFNNKVFNSNKKFLILRFCTSIYSDCHSTYGDLYDKENIN